MKPFIDFSNFENIKETVSYGFSLINNYSKWDKTNIPNPEQFREEDEETISITDHAFIRAITYILSHKFSHTKFSHTEKICKKTELETEVEVDENAFKMILKGIVSNLVRNLAFEKRTLS